MTRSVLWDSSAIVALLDADDADHARENVETYRAVLHEEDPQVVALSSGFMTYAHTIHPEYARLREDIGRSPTTFVLIPSLNRELCVAETVRRQLARPFIRSRTKEETAIRERFPIYVGLPAPKIETMRPLTDVVNELLVLIETARSANWD